MPDYRIQVGYWDHPKTVRLKRRLGAEGVLSHLALMAFVAQSKPDGNLFGMSHEDIAIAARWEGEDGVFVATLVELRLLDESPEGVKVHDWSEHQPWVSGFEKRSAASRKAVKQRWEKRLRAFDTNDDTDDTDTDRIKKHTNRIENHTDRIHGGYGSHTNGIESDTDRMHPPIPLSFPHPSLPSGSEEEKLDRSLTPHLDGGKGAYPAWKKDASFARFWESFPACKRKKAAGKAFDRWKVHKLGNRIEVVLARLEEDKRSTDWTKDRGDFIPAPEVWLNKRRWEDDAIAPPPIPQARQAAPGTSPTAPAPRRHPYSGKPWAPIADAHWGTESTRIATGQDGDLGFVFLIARMKGHNGNQAVRILHAHGIDAAVTYAVLGKEPDHDPGGQSTAA